MMHESRPMGGFRASTETVAMADDITPTLGRRIVVVGSTGSGKSTVAETLALRLGIPFVELDELFWLPNWVELDEESFRAKVAEATAGENWVIAGNYRRTSIDVIWPLVDTMVVLEVSLATQLRRLVARSWRRSRSKELLWGTNYERFSKHFLHRDSLLLFAIRTHRATRARYRSMMADPKWAHIDFIHLRSPADAARWLATDVPMIRQSDSD